MQFQVLLKSTLLSAIALLAVAASPLSAQQAASNVPAGIQLSKDLGPSDPTEMTTITVHMQLPNRAAFDKAVDALYDPASPTYHHWMTNADLAKFAPSEAQRETVREELQRNGLSILSTDKIGFFVRAEGTLGNVARAFNTEIHDFQYNGSTFRANIRNAQLSGEAAQYVSTVAGIEQHQIRPMYMLAMNPITKKPYPPVELTDAMLTSGFPNQSTTQCLSAPETVNLGKSPVTATYTGTVYGANGLYCDYLPNQLQATLGLLDVYDAGYDGTGQTIVLVEGFGYPTTEQDANTFSTLGGLPQFTSSNFQIVYPEGQTNLQDGILSGWSTEIALDIDSSHSVAPGANIVEVYTKGQLNEPFQTSITYVAENDLGNSVSNSYEEDVDLLAGKMEQTSWDDVLEVATAKGISVNFSTGDGGDGGLGTPWGAPGVPSIAPHATGVGGTSILNDPSHPGNTITTSWGDTAMTLATKGVVAAPPVPFESLNGFLGGGGGGESSFWPKPSWQSSLQGNQRQSPDVSALADPNTGVPVVITYGKNQVVLFGVGGTSLACPIFSAFWALANEKAGTPLGQAAPLIAGLPYGSVEDVLPTSDSTRNNVQGSITYYGQNYPYLPFELFLGFLDGNLGFTSTLVQTSTGDTLDLGFGIDTSLHVKKGFDLATGYGTPYGMTFINAVAP
jgi:subtilase family serine protease